MRTIRKGAGHHGDHRYRMHGLSGSRMSRPIADGTQDTLIVRRCTPTPALPDSGRRTPPRGWRRPSSRLRCRTTWLAVYVRSSSGPIPSPSRRGGTTCTATRRSSGVAAVVIHALSAIDIALWDILGKTLERPIHCPARRCPDGSGSDPTPVSSRSRARHRERRERALQLVDAGFRAIKFGWSGLGSRCRLRHRGRRRPARGRRRGRRPHARHRRAHGEGRRPAARARARRVSASPSWRSRCRPTMCPDTPSSPRP